MKIFDVIKVAWKSLWGNKLRSLLTMLGVIIGVAAVIIMVSVSEGTSAQIAETINGLGANLVFISSNFSMGGARMMGGGASGGLVYDDVTAIAESIPNIAGVAVEQSTSVTIKSEDVIMDDVSVVGTTPDFPTVRELEVGLGRFINDNEMEKKAKVIVLGATISQELFGNSNPIGEQIIVGTQRLTVVGVMEEKGLVSGTDYDSNVYIPITLLFQKYIPNFFAAMTGDSVNMIYVAAESKEVINDVITQLELLLAKRHDVALDDLDFQISTQDDIIETQESTTSSFRTLLGWVAGVSLIVGGIGIMNIMLVSVTERTREIGIRQAVGATPIDIRGQFLTEALILSLLGGFIGVALGIVGSWLFGKFGGMPTVVYWYSVVLAFTSAAAVGILFGFLPANKAAQLDPIVALRHE
jgi:putative ABC transport system permease protein